MKEKIKKIIVTIFIFTFILISLAPQQVMAANFSSDYVLTGKSATDIVAVANAQRWRSQSQMGYSYAWCAAFVSDCAHIIGEGNSVPWNAGVANLYSAVINAGGQTTSSPQPGDLVFYQCKTCGYAWKHVGIMTGASISVQGNVNGQVYEFNPYHYLDDGGHGTSVMNVVFVRPKYKQSVIEPKGISLNKTGLTFSFKGATATLIATVTPSNATDKSVTWKSSNTAIATVDSSGKVTAIADGVATITATTKSGGKVASCKVSVSIPTLKSDGWYYTSVLLSSITSSKYDIQCKNKYVKNATSSPGTGWTATGKYTEKYDWLESDTLLTTSSKLVYAGYYYYHWCSGSPNAANFYQTDTYKHWDEIKDGSLVTEYASYKDGENKNLNYYHLKWKDGSDAYCRSGKTCDASWGEHGERCYYWYKKYIYKNNYVRTNEYVKESAWGSTVDSSATSVTYRYKAKDIIPTGVSLNKTSATLTSKGATVGLIATVTPSNATNKNVTWKSSNTNVATVNANGVVTAVGNGTATITVTTNSGGKTATCNVTVSIATTGVTLNKTSATLTSKGATLTLVATVAPENAANKNVTWKSSDTSVATVDSNGVVKAIKNGTATITVTTVNGGKTATCKITVKYSTEKKYTITYVLNGGKNSSKNPTSYKKSTATIKLKNPTRKGYTFKGWYSDSKFKKKVTQIKKGSTGNKKLYAKWEANKYKIVFKGNGSTSGSMKSMTSCKYGKTYTLSKNKYTRKGYKFVGWNTKKDGSGKMYTNKDKIKNLTSTNGKTVTLYAIWKKK